MAVSAELARFLCRGESYGLPGVGVTCIETHCSNVYLVGNLAYKLKRPVAFSSVDYRILARRETACRAEIENNRHAAPDLYLGVHSIRRRGDGTLRLDGDGEAVDWLVAMRRFDQADLFDQLCSSGNLTPPLIRALSDEIARVHRNAEVAPAYGGASGLRNAAEWNHRDLLTVDSILDRNAVDQLNAETLAAIAASADALDARRAHCVRRVHGDLRLANICLVDGRPTLFDAIEFSEALTCIDTLYDLAFLLVDLQQRGKAYPANILFNRYLDVIGDDDGIGLVPLMLSVRAATRAYTLAGSALRRKTTSEATTLGASANSMLTLALQLLRRSAPRLIAIGGLGGSRKSRVVGELSATLLPQSGARILRSGPVRQQLVGLGADERLTPSSYRADIGDSVYDDLLRHAGKVLATGYSVVIDASFFYPRHRRMLEAMVASAAVPFACFWLGGADDMATDPGDEPADDWPVLANDDDAHLMAAAGRLVRAARRP